MLDMCAGTESYTQAMKNNPKSCSIRKPYMYDDFSFCSHNFCRLLSNKCQLRD